MLLACFFFSASILSGSVYLLIRLEKYEPKHPNDYYKRMVE